MIRNKKSQMEIMGLAIIMILIIMGVLFALRFVITKPSSEVGAEFRQTQLAANTLSAIKSTKTTCRDTTISQLLQDCARGGSLNCGGKNSCEFAEEVLGQIFAETFETWKKPYYFSIKGPPQLTSIAFGTACPGEKEFKSTPLPYGSGTATLQIELCN